MPELTLSWVSDLSEPDQRGNRYINVAFEEWKDTAYAGKKDLDAGIELHGLLKENVGVLQDFQLEDSGKKNKKGATRWKILGFGTPGGASTYVAPGVQGERAHPPAAAERSRPPELNTEASIRASVAIKAAVELGGDINTVFENADAINAWLDEKTSQEARPLPAESAGTDVESGGSSSEGEAGGDPTPHQHDWYPHPNLRNWLKCNCGEARKKEGYARA